MKNFLLIFSLVVFCSACKKNNSAAVRQGTLTSYSNTDICAFSKEVPGEKVLVLANPRNVVINYTIPAALVNSSWTDIMNNTTTTVGSQVNLQPYSYLILKQ